MPAVAELVAVSVKVLIEDVTAGLKKAMIPFGTADAVKETLEANPPKGLTLIILAVDPPGTNVSVDAEDDRENPAVLAPCVLA